MVAQESLGAAIMKLLLTAFFNVLHSTVGRKKAPTISEPQLAMRAEAHKFEAIAARLAVDENEIRSDVAVAVVAPFAGQWVIEIPARQRRVGGGKLTTSISRASSFLPCRPDFSRR